MKDIGVHKGLAQFGDTVTNMTYSAAKSLVTNYLEGKNVNRTILSLALKNADMKIYARVRSDAHSMADTAEAFIGYMYCSGKWSLEYIIDFLVSQLKNKPLKEDRQEIESATLAFTALLAKIKEELLPIFECEEKNHNSGS
jgi:hypothetical protein